MSNSALKVVVVGLGYVGESVTLTSVAAGHDTVGLDLSQSRLEQLASRQPDNSENFLLSDDFAHVQAADVVVVCVPTPVDEQLKPDYGNVVAAMKSVGMHLSGNPEQLIVLESTVAPGTTSGLVRETLEAVSGKIAGEDFALAFSSERVDPSNTVFSIRNTPKVVAGLTSRCTSLAVDFYQSLVEKVVIASGLEEAETSKLLENAYRHVNIAFINEVADICLGLGVDAREVVELASTKPFGFQAFWPGLGAGGHCIPVDPNYLQAAAEERLGFGSEMISLANSVNEARPRKIATRILDDLESLDKRVGVDRNALILGLSYKANVGDFRESRQLRLAEELVNLGITPWLHDPYFPAFGDWPGRKIEDGDLIGKIAESDVVILGQPHSFYLKDGLLERVADKLWNTTGIRVSSRWSI